MNNPFILPLYYFFFQCLYYPFIAMFISLSSYIILHDDPWWLNWSSYNSLQRMINVESNKSWCSGICSKEPRSCVVCNILCFKNSAKCSSHLPPFLLKYLISILPRCDRNSLNQSLPFFFEFSSVYILLYTPATPAFIL